MKDYEESRSIGPAASWALIIGVCAVVIAWGVVTYLLVPDRPRQWDFGQLPDAPGESIYSTSRPGGAAPAPEQMQPLPEARPPEGPAGPASARPGTKP